jgi:cysteine synthase A
MISKVEQLSIIEGNYWTMQFKNPDVLLGFSGMGREILAQLQDPIDIFCAAVGSGGMVLGVSNELKKTRKETRIVVLEPESAPLITKGVKGAHKVDGIGVGFIPPFVEELKYDEARTVDEKEARIMAKRLAKEEGVFAGTSTGMNVVGAIEQGMKLGSGGTVVTVACDSGMKYLSSGLFD